MARPGWPERNGAARSFRQLRRFHHVINSDKVLGTHSEPVSVAVQWRQLRPLLDADADCADLELRLIKLTPKRPRACASACRQRQLMAQSGLFHKIRCAKSQMSGAAAKLDATHPMI